MYRIILCLFLLQFSISTAQTVQYTMPSEESLHEGTWLQWPHDYTYNFGASDFEPTWIEMTEALITGENVHIIAYNEEEKNHIEYIYQSNHIKESQLLQQLKRIPRMCLKIRMSTRLYDIQSLFTNQSVA